jgi:hypothetical protein
MGAAEWKKVIEECHASGISIKSWCKQQGVTYSSYQYWAKKLKNQPQQWAQVQALPKANAEIKIHCGKITIAIEDKVSLELLADIFRVVNDLCY